MQTAQFLFWLFFSIVFYAFLGYGLVLFVMVKVKRVLKNSDNNKNVVFEPPISLVIPCFNEADILAEKIANCDALNYPKNKLKLIFITDGSTDNSVEVLKDYHQVTILHEDRRAGKTAAENRAMKYIDTPFVVFSDANTMLNQGAMKNIVQHFADEKVGCVSGEKRIITEAEDSASAAGEGIYWKYESLLKKWDSELYSAVGAAGELVAFRTSLYTNLPEDTLLDDFMQSMLMAAKGYKIVYEPEAYALETASSNVAEELKRKIRICAGGWQSINRLQGHLTFAKTPLLFFQYVSHRVLRWTVTPFLLVAMFLINCYLATEGNSFYEALLAAQVLFYVAAIVGNVLANKKIKFKPVFIPYYFCIMNYSVVAGLRRYLSGNQKATWDKAQRKVVMMS
jgi:poly-beta-1,6-N-acetyl-D-glucosamine synthase